jgi:Zn-dependent protease with chaperone function
VATSAPTEDARRSLRIAECIYPGETARYWLALAVVVPGVVLYVVMTVGIGLLVVPMLLFAAWFATCVLRAHLLGSCVAVSPNNFPAIHDMLCDICDRLDYHKRIEVYIFQEGEVNAFLRRHFRTRIIMLPDALVRGMGDDENRNQMIWILARCVGHLKAKHLRLTWLSVLVESFERLFVLNLFLYPWERATQYSGDRIGLAACRDLPAALMAMRKLMIGNDLAAQATLRGALLQRRQLVGSAFAIIAELYSTHPHLTRRMASLIEWAKEYDERLYAPLQREVEADADHGNLLEVKGARFLAVRAACIILLMGMVFPGIPVIVAIGLPSLSRARELARRTVCGTNLRSLAVALQVYANENYDRFPPDLTTLIDAGYAEEGALHCPSSAGEIGDVDRCYRYIPGQSSESDLRNVVIHEDPECHNGEGGAAAFVDGHARFLPVDELDRMVRETRTRLAQGAPR